MRIHVADGKDKNLLACLQNFKADHDGTAAQEREHLRWFASTTANRRDVVMQIKGKLYNYRASTPELLAAMQELRHAKQLDLACLVIAIAVYRASGMSHRFAIKTTVAKPKPVHLRRTSLAYKLRLHLGEIQEMQAKGYSWPRIAQILKQEWRKTYKDYKIDPSYLRKTAQALAAEQRHKN